MCAPGVAQRRITSPAYADDQWVPSWLLEGAEEEAEQRGAAPIRTITPVPYAKDVFVPTLHVQAIADPWTDLDHVREIHRQLPQPKEMLWLEEPEHRFDTYNYFGSDPAKLLAFLDKYLRK